MLGDQCHRAITRAIGGVFFGSHFQTVDPNSVASLFGTDRRTVLAESLVRFIEQVADTVIADSVKQRECQGNINRL